MRAVVWQDRGNQPETMTNTPTLFRAVLAPLFVVLASGGALMGEAEQDEKLRALDGEWLFVEDRTEGRAVEDGGAPMSMRFRLIVGLVVRTGG